MKQITPSRDTTLTLFLQMARSIRARMEHTMPLPFAQCEILTYACSHHNPTMRDVAHYLKITAPSATSLVEGLADAGYLTRVRDTKDRRAVRIKLTAHGKRAEAAIAKSRTKVLRGIFAGLSVKDRRDLDRILTNIVKDL